MSIGLRFKVGPRVFGQFQSIEHNFRIFKNNVNVMLDKKTMNKKKHKKIKI